MKLISPFSEKLNRWLENWVPGWKELGWKRISLIAIAIYVAGQTISAILQSLTSRFIEHMEESRYWLLVLGIVLFFAGCLLCRIYCFRFKNRFQKLEGENFFLRIQQQSKGGTCESFTVNGLEFPFVYCPAGKSFTSSFFGSEVEISKGFWILSVPVTQKMWKSVVGDNPSFFQSQDDTHFYISRKKHFRESFKEIKTTDLFPVESVNAYDCATFINRFNEIARDNFILASGLKADLPTCYEWEYACRCGEDSNNVSLGANLNEEKANYGGDQDNGRTTKVKEYPPNNWGIYDMIGNVEEWTRTDENGSDFNIMDKSLSPRDLVVCGGSWHTAKQNLAEPDKCSAKFEQKDGTRGFRIVLREVPLKYEIHETRHFFKAFIK